MPLRDNKTPSSPSVFQPAALLREARRQKRLATVDVPALCILDPDGDIVRRLRQTGQAQPFPNWPCYHTVLDTFTLAGQTVGIVGCAVGAPFAVLIAEELFASGCQVLVSITSAGQITPAGPAPYFVIIDRALRDEGTSYHYAAPSEYSHADPGLVAMALAAFKRTGLPVTVGASWTTDAPFRETAEAIAAARAPKACWRSRWKPPRSMHSRKPRASRCSVSPMSPIRWDRPDRILRRAKPTAPPMRCAFWKPSCRRDRPNRHAETGWRAGRAAAIVVGTRVNHRSECNP